MRRTTALLLVVAVAALGTARTAGGGGTVKVCGQPLYTAADIGVPTDVSSGATRLVGDGRFALALTDDCDHGVDLTVDPADATILTEAHARDGKVAGVYLEVETPPFDATVTRADGSTYELTFTGPSATGTPTPANLPSP